MIAFYMFSIASFMHFVASIWPAVWLWWLPRKAYLERLHQTALYRAIRAEEDKKFAEQQAYLDRLKLVEKASRSEIGHKLVEGFTQLGIYYRYKREETRSKKGALIQRIALVWEIIAPDFVCYSLTLPHGIHPHEVLNQTFQDDLRIITGRPDLQIIATPNDGLFCFVPLRGSRDGIPDTFFWRGGDLNAFNLLPPDRPYAVPIGLGPNRQFVYLDLTEPADDPHLLVGGTTGGGKSNMMNQMICTLLERCTPDMAQFAMFDLKLVELQPYRNIPHLWDKVVTRSSQVVGLLQKLLDELERRLDLFSTIDARHINEWNTKNPEQQVPRLFVIMDELALVIQTTGKDAETAISQLAALGRAAGIHIIALTQRPSVDVVTGVIKTNMPTRLAFNADEMGSRTILGNGMASELDVKGRAIFMSKSKFTSLQTPLITSEQIEATIAKARAYQPDYKPIKPEEIVKVSVGHRVTNVPELVKLLKERDAHISVGRVSRTLWAHHYNPAGAGPIVKGETGRYILWRGKWIELGNHKPPATAKAVEQLEIFG